MTHDIWNEIKKKINKLPPGPNTCQCERTHPKNSQMPPHRMACRSDKALAPTLVAMAATSCAPMVHAIHRDNTPLATTTLCKVVGDSVIMTPQSFEKSFQISCFFCVFFQTAPDQRPEQRHFGGFDSGFSPQPGTILFRSDRSMCLT